MTTKEFNSFKRSIKESAKKNLPKCVKVAEFSDDMTIYLTIPMSKRMSDEYSSIDDSIEAWAKTFGYEEYGSGTGGKGYDIHIGPGSKLLKDQAKRIKDAIKSTFSKMDSLHKMKLFEEAIDNMKSLYLVPKDVDVSIHPQIG